MCVRARVRARVHQSYMTICLFLPTLKPHTDVCFGLSVMKTKIVNRLIDYATATEQPALLSGDYNVIHGVDKWQGLVLVKIPPCKQSIIVGVHGQCLSSFVAQTMHCFDYPRTVQISPNDLRHLSSV